MQAQKYSIKQWAKDERPREKLRMLGASTLSNAELLAILLHSGTRTESALDLARNIMSGAGNDIVLLSKMPVKELQKIKGIGQARAMTIIAAFELGRRRQLSTSPARQIMRNSSEMAGFLKPLLEDYRHEVFGVVFLNRANKVNHFEIISQGGISATVVDTRIIIRKALEYDAVNLVLCHNHPSGNLRPSGADHSLTQKIKEAATFFEIKVLDHLIISQEGYYSFADQGEI